jgi:colanic acid/amylovoran biosynthesis glycosyltransferase
LETLDRGYAGTVTAAAESARETRGTSLRIAYLLSQYPAISHTFFLHEVIGLRARGLHIETASINRPDRSIERLPAREAAEARSTEYIKSGSLPGMAIALLATVLLHPLVTARGLAAVLTMPRLTLRQRGFWFFYLAEALLVGRWMRKRRLTHLHVHFGGPVASVGLLVARAWKMPFSLTIHGPEELLNVDANHLREKIEHASFVICISDFCRSQLCQLTTPASWSRFKVVRLGVDPFVLSPAIRSSDPLRSEPPKILELLCTGRLVAAKGHFILLQALSLLRGRNIHIHATFIGAGPERRTLEDYVASQNLGNRVTFASALSHADTLELVRKADIFALASFAEGIPVALMEAMSLAIPCVSTTIAGIPELIRSGLDGLLVPPANAEALAAALGSLARDPSLRKRLGASARQRILTDYNLPLNQEHLAMILDDLVRAAAIPDQR